MMKPKWFRLLEEQRHGKGLGPSGPTNIQRLGLTVVFLVGARREPPGAPLQPESVAEVRDMLKEMMTPVESGSVVRIYECDSLNNQPTVCLSNVGSMSLGDSVLWPDGLPSALYAWPQYFGTDSRDLESVSQRLWDLLRPHIQRGAFSHRQGSYQEYNDDDRVFIQRAYAREDDSDDD